MLEIKTVTNGRPFYVHVPDGYVPFAAFEARSRRP